MCGITGYFSSQNDVDAKLLGRMSDALMHRGPDGSGIFIDKKNKIGLAHRRLAIVGLGEQGAQPMVSYDGRFVIIFNGEIYNHPHVRSFLESNYTISWRGNSDTEILVNAIAAIGLDETLKIVDGMFAFALWDMLNSSLTLVRDRVGEKPLYYQNCDGLVIFGSELKSLFVHPKCQKVLSNVSLTSYFFMGWNACRESIIQGIYRLQPATYITFGSEGNVIKSHTYWNLPDFDQSSFVLSEDEVLNQVEKALKNSVKRQSRAEVPIGILLSGGIDSSLITAMVAEQGGTVRTFNVSNSSSPEIDETQHAKLIANHFGTKHTIIDAEEISPNDFIRLSNYCDEPLSDMSLFPSFLVSESIKKYCTVAIGGDGGDELFGGYQRHSYCVAAESRGSFIVSCKSLGSRVIGPLFPMGNRGWRYLVNKIGSPKEITCSGYVQESINNLNSAIDVNAFGINRADPRAEFFQKYDMRKSALKNVLSLDFSTYLPDDLLVKTDRASMAFGLELRAPFLSREVIEIAAKIVPDRLKNNGLQRKIALIKLCKKHLPSCFLTGRKQGFSISTNRLLNSEVFRKFFVDLISEAPAGLLRKDNLIRAVNDQGQSINGNLLMKTIIFELWRRRWSPSFQ